MQRRIDSYGTGVYTTLADIMNGEGVLPSIWWISARAQNCESWWIFCHSHGRAGLRNKPLSPALCHVFTTLPFANISQQNQSVSRLLSKTILFFLHPLYSYLTIHFLIFLFVLALNSIFFYNIIILGANDQICCQKEMTSRLIPSDVLFMGRRYFQIKITCERLWETSWAFFWSFFFPIL